METEMVTVLVNGQGIQIPKGETLEGALKKKGGLKMPCAGNGICGKCKVTAEGALSEPDETERCLLTEEERNHKIRLACRTRVLGDCRIFFTGGEINQGKENLQKEGSAANPLFFQLGAAIDIGTTTMAAALYGEDGLLARAGCDNPQAVFGADVISRIEKSMAGEAEALAGAVKEGIVNLLEALLQKSGRSADELDTIVICGNTAMLYLLTARDPKPLSRAPFAADWLAGEWLTGQQLGLSGCKNARIYLPPCISAFVGADITMAMLTVTEEKENRLLVDIGTNGEIVLWKKGGIVCCSTAAGPAFEGAGLKMGMPGTDGAVSHVTAGENGLCAEVIGNTEPAGICGSGVIDAVSCLLQTGQMDETGYLEEEEAVIAGKVRLFQEDIRKIQLAKSAICAGILSMLHRAGLAVEDLEELLVAGGFGSFIRLENAIAIGLLPPIDTEKITVCGNAALAGAVLLLRDASLMGKAAALAERAETVNLASDEFFKNAYMEGMLFGDGSF